MKYLKKKLFSLAIVALIAIGGLASVYGYQEYFYRWSDNGGGGDHGGCAHDGTQSDPSIPLESTNGTLNITLETTGTIHPYDEIEITFDIFNFTEALITQYFVNSSYSGESWRVSHGIPGYRGDNALFTMNTSHQYMNRGESLDALGNMIDDNDAKYILYAPSSAGVYTLVVTAMGAMNQSSMEAYNITYIEGSIQITVVAAAPAAPGGDSIPGFLTIILVSSITVTVFAVVLKVRRKKRIIE